MSTPKTLKCKGLYTAGNRYDVPEGALVKATNILILRDGIIQPRWTAQNRGVSTVLGNVSYWHRWAELNGTLYMAGRDTNTNTLTIGTAGIRTSFSGVTANYSSQDAPSKYSLFESSTTLPFFDMEFVNIGRALYGNWASGMTRWEGPLLRQRAGGLPCAVSCFPRPFKIVAGGLTKANGTTTVVVTTPINHGYVAGLKIKMTSAGEVEFPAGEYTIATVPSATTYTYDTGGAAAVGNKTSAADQIIGACQFVGSSGFMATNDQVAYRAHLVEYDSNNTKYVREVSGRIVVENASPFVGTAANKNVQLAILFMPAVALANSRIELYRTARTPSGDPGDEMGLVYSKYLTEDERNAGIVWITDITPDLQRGRPLYTNESQETALANNAVLPAAKTVARWGSRLVQANIVDIPNIDMQLLSTDSSAGGLAVGDAVSVYINYDWDFTALASSAGMTTVNEFLLFTGGVASTDVRNTVLSLIEAINWGNASPFSNGLWMGVYTAIPGSWAGRFTLKWCTPQNQAEYGDVEAMSYTVSAKTTGTGTRGCFAPKLGAKHTVSGSPVRGPPGAADTTLITFTSNHNFEVGEYVIWYTTFNNTTQTKGTISGSNVEGKITAKTATTITIENAGTSATSGSSGGVVVLKYRPLILGARSKNLVRVSRKGNPEAFTNLSIVEVGSPDAHILKCVGLGDALLVFKEDGLFKVTASGPDDRDLSSELLDPNAILWAKDTAVTLGGVCYAWLRRGVAKITASGVQQYVSDRVADKLDWDRTAGTAATLDDMPFSKRAFAIADEVLGLYELRVCTGSGSYPYAATVNLIYCPGTDTWVEDDLAMVGGCLVNGSRHYQVGTSYFYQRANSETNYNLTTTNLTSLGAYDTATQTVGFTYSGTAPSVDDSLYLVGGGTSYMGKVLSASGGSGTAYFPYGNSFYTVPSYASVTTVAFCTPVTSTIEWAPITLAEQNRLKNQREVQVLFGVQSLLYYYVKTSTDLIPSLESNRFYTGKYLSPSIQTSNWPSLLYFVPVNNRFPIPTQHRVGQQLSLRLVIPSALEEWTILGVGVDGAGVSAKVGR